MRPKGKATAFDKQKKYIRQMEKAKKQGFYAQEVRWLKP